MDKRFQYSESVRTKRARLALCEPKNGRYDWAIKHPLPEIITGYDPTYILQFGFPPEHSYIPDPINLEHGKDTYLQ